ncbi:MAG: response regulator [Planctomycetota bacterium]
MKKRILLVDDDRSLLALFEEALAAPDREFDTAHEQRTAEELAGRKRYDLVISDVFLPDTKAFALVDFLKAAHLDYRVILVSGYFHEAVLSPAGSEAVAGDSVLMLAERKGVFACLPKPLGLDTLRSTVNAALEA